MKPKYCSMTCQKLEEEVLISFLKSKSQLSHIYIFSLICRHPVKFQTNLNILSKDTISMSVKNKIFLKEYK